ncbi:ribosome biogenesis protein WDR12 homolog [Lineus longissimus]|uniref:ribosome biogenesis protein WDR12 homolog n=1 Tax=Lineus longissimus TaxID=88925 RepID=UPI002B4CB9FA
MASVEGTVSHLQVKFFTKQPQFSVPDNPFSVPSSCGLKELSDLINGLLQSAGTGGLHPTEFDFLVEGQFLRTTLEKHIEQTERSTEEVLELEYLERQPAPAPQDSLQHDDWVSCLHAQGEHILSGCYDNTVKLWTSRGDIILTIPGHSAPVKSISWIAQDEASSTFLSGSHDQTILIWEWNRTTNAMECLYMCKGHAGSIDCLAVDETKSRFCSGSFDRMIKIWAAGKGGSDEMVEEDEGHQKKKKRTDGQKVPTRVPLMTLSGHKEGVAAIQWLSSSEICSASWDHTMKLWDVQQGVEKSVLAGTKVFLDISYSPLNRMIISGSADRHVRLWDPRIRDGAVVKCTYTSHTGWISSVSWSPINEHLFISGSYDTVMKLWDTRSPKTPMYNMTGHEDKIMAVDWSLPDLMLSGGADNEIKIFRYSTVPGSS